MPALGIRELMHNFSHYLKEVKGGKSITVMERNVPVAEIIPHNRNVRYPGWKRALARRKIKGEAFSATVEKSREQE